MATEREKMLAAGFPPQEPINPGPEWESARSLKYIALYLSEIEKHLGKIAATCDTHNTNGTRTAQAMVALQQFLPRLANR